MSILTGINFRNYSSKSWRTIHHVQNHRRRAVYFQMGQMVSVLDCSLEKTIAMFWKILGSLLIAKYGISFASFFITFMKLYVLPRFGIKLNLKKYGQWAVITGATDGIGKAIAKQLARRGLNIVLISRSEEKLESVKEELSQGNAIEIKTISYDFNKSDGYDEIDKNLEGLDIGILVNNVGMSYDHPDYYLYHDEEFYEKMVNLNIISVLKMTRIVMKGMEERKRGLLVHVSSSSSLFSVPFLSAYSASKAFVNNFGESLHYECLRKGIKSQVVYPYFVATKLSKMRPSGLTIPSADTYAKQMVDAIGLSTTMAGFWSHEILVHLQCLLPKFIVLNQTVTMMLALKKKWDRKQLQKND